MLLKSSFLEISLKIEFHQKKAFSIMRSNFKENRFI